MKIISTVPISTCEGLSNWKKKKNCLNLLTFCL